MSDGIVEHEGGYSLRLSRKSATGYRHVTYNNRTGNYQARIQRAGDDDIQSCRVAAATTVPADRSAVCEQAHWQSSSS